MWYSKLFGSYLEAVVSWCQPSPAVRTCLRGCSRRCRGQNCVFCQVFADIFLLIGAGQHVPKPRRYPRCHGNAALLVTLVVVGAGGREKLNNDQKKSRRGQSLPDLTERSSYSPYLAFQRSSGCISPGFHSSTQNNQCFSCLWGRAKSVSLVSTRPSWWGMHYPPWKYEHIWNLYSCMNSFYVQFIHLKNPIASQPY